MAINDIVQSIAEARVDARSLSEFVFKPAGFKVARRLAPPVDTLQFYINRLNTLDGDFSSSVSVALSSLNNSVAEADGKVAYIETTVQDAITNTVISSGFVTIDSFELGATLTQRNEALRHTTTGKLYRWAGDLPKTVAIGSTPESSGGIAANAWLEVSDTVLRQELLSTKGAAMLLNGVVSVNSYQELLVLNSESKREDIKYIVQGSIFRFNGSDFMPLSGIDAKAFGIVPDTDANLSVANLQLAVDLCSQYEVPLNISAGLYKFNQSATQHGNYVQLELKPNLTINAVGANLKDLIALGDGDASGITINGGRFYNSVSVTNYIFSLRGSNVVFNDVHLDQELPATSASPWLYIQSGANPENYEFNNCKFTNRTNIHMWNFKNVVFNNCHIHNRYVEDGIVVKAYKGRGAVSHLRVNGGTFINTTGAFAVGTELGEDASDLKASGVTLKDCQHAVFIKPNSSVTPIPELRGGSVYDVRLTDITLNDIKGVNFLSPISIRLSDGSEVKGVSIDGLAVNARSRIGTFNAAALTYQVNNGSTGKASDISIRNISFNGLHVGAENPSDLDIDGQSAFGYAVNSIINQDEYTSLSASLSNVYIEGDFSGISRFGVVFDDYVRWGDVDINKSVFSTLSPRGAISIGANPVIDIKSLSISEFQSTTDRLVTWRKVGDTTLSETVSNNTLVSKMSGLTTTGEALFIAPISMMLVSVKTMFMDGITGSDTDFATFNLGVIKKGTTTFVPFVGSNSLRKNTIQTIPANSVFTVWDASQSFATGFTLPNIIINAGDVVVLSKIDKGLGVTVPSASYSVLYVPIRNTVA